MCCYGSMIPSPVRNTTSSFSTIFFFTLVAGRITLFLLRILNGVFGCDSDDEADLACDSSGERGDDEATVYSASFFFITM